LCRGVKRGAVWLAPASVGLLGARMGESILPKAGVRTGIGLLRCREIGARCRCWSNRRTRCRAALGGEHRVLMVALGSAGEFVEHRAGLVCGVDHCGLCRVQQREVLLGEGAPAVGARRLYLPCGAGPGLLGCCVGDAKVMGAVVGQGDQVICRRRAVCRRLRGKRLSIGVPGSRPDWSRRCSCETSRVSRS
jgi:hypothetical protein